MRVADSSFLVEGLLKEKALLEEDFLLTADLVLYETVNAIWKHQILLRDIKDGLPYISILYELIESGRIRLIHPEEELMEEAYSLATKRKRSIYDAIFVSLAVKLGLKLATLDKRQTELLRAAGG